MTDQERIEALERKVDLFERVIRAFVEHPFVYGAASYRPLLEELGYEVHEEKGATNPELRRVR